MAHLSGKAHHHNSLMGLTNIQQDCVPIYRVCVKFVCFYSYISGKNVNHSNLVEEKSDIRPEKIQRKNSIGNECELKILSIDRFCRNSFRL